LVRNAKINQDPAYRTAQQNVNVTASGEVQTMNMAGVVGPYPSENQSDQ